MLPPLEGQSKMKRRIILHGYLKKLVPQQIELAVSTIAEAIEALCVVTGKALHPTASAGRHRVAVVGFPTLDAMRSPLGDDVEEIHLVPAFAGGGGGGGMFQVVLGVVIIVASIITYQYGGHRVRHSFDDWCHGRFHGPRRHPFYAHST